MTESVRACSWGAWCAALRWICDGDVNVLAMGLRGFHDLREFYMSRRFRSLRASQPNCERILNAFLSVDGRPAALPPNLLPRILERFHRFIAANRGFGDALTQVRALARPVAHPGLNLDALRVDFGAEAAHVHHRQVSNVDMCFDAYSFVLPLLAEAGLPVAVKRSFQ